MVRSWNEPISQSSGRSISPLGRESRARQVSRPASPAGFGPAPFLAMALDRARAGGVPAPRSDLAFLKE